MQPNLAQPSAVPRKWLSLILFLAVAGTGLFWAKWQPYFYKVFHVAETHTLGPSILTGSGDAIPEPSWQAAWGYSVAYFKAIWKAMLVATVLASLVQVLIPRNWIRCLLGKSGFASTLNGGLLSLPGMMCTCCAAPIVVSLRQCASSVGAALAFWFGNTALNPAVLVFMFFVLGMEFTVLRLFAGLILVFGVSYLANRIAGAGHTVAPELTDDSRWNQDERLNTKPFLIRWGYAFARMLTGMTPLYVLTVLTLGAARAWLFPQAGPELADSVWLIIALAVTGALFVIPTAAEIPIMQMVLAMGLGSGPAAALMTTLPVISLPSLLMVRKAFPPRVLVFVTASVVLLGFAAGLIAVAV